MTAPFTTWPVIADMLENVNTYPDIMSKRGICRACRAYTHLYAAAGSAEPVICARCADDAWLLRIRPPRWASLGPVLLAAAGCLTGGYLLDRILSDTDTDKEPRP